jgi:hypothetical protein
VHFQNSGLQNNFELLSNPLQKKETPTQRQSVCGEAPIDCLSQKKKKKWGKGEYSWREGKNKKKKKMVGCGRVQRVGGVVV